MRKHEHDFEHCGYDEQQCDNECQANWHKCAICKKSRSEVAKQPKEVKAYVKDSTRQIINDLNRIMGMPTLAASVAVIEDCSKRLDWLRREQLVEMAVWNETHR
jgi:hypothetical protein